MTIRLKKLTQEHSFKFLSDEKSPLNSGLYIKTVDEIEKNIKSFSVNLGFHSVTNHRIVFRAKDLAKKYLQKLDQAEERVSLDVALSALYLSCLQLNKKISQSELAGKTKQDLLGWPCVAEDMTRKLTHDPAYMSNKR